MEKKEVIKSLHHLRKTLNEAIDVAEADCTCFISENVAATISECQALVENVYCKLYNSSKVILGENQASQKTESSNYGSQESQTLTDEVKQLSGNKSSDANPLSWEKTGDEDFDDIDFDDFFSPALDVTSKDKDEHKKQQVDDFDDADDILLNTSIDDADLDIPEELLLEDECTPSQESQLLETTSNENDILDQPDKVYLDVLKHIFGHSEFRHHQWGIIDSVLNQKRDSCVIMSTGYGKSLTFQFPSVYTGRSSIVISPLISLMEDQVRALQASGIKSCYLGSAQKKSREVYQAMLDGKYRLIYATPEFLSFESNLTLFKKLHESYGIDLFAIDEAHCVSQWGVDFRESYRQLGCIKRNFPSVPILAVTATATARVQKDICSLLKLKNPKMVCTSFDRPNLFLSVMKKQGDMLTDLKSLMDKDGKQYLFHGPTIIYCPTRALTDTVASTLSGMKVTCLAYHAGLSDKTRKEAHHRFLNDEIQVIVATVAFGMGIDKPDVRQVIHYGAPKDVESYYQEIGRAGRDGMRSYCKVLYAESDFKVNMFMLKNIEDSNHRKHKFEMFQKMKSYLSTQKCRRRQLLSYFEKGSVEEIGGTVNCCDCCRMRILSERNKVQSSREDLSVPETIDYGQEAADLFSAIQSTGGYYGLGMPALVLTGSRSQKTSRFTKLPIFEKGKYRSQKFWTVLGKYLIEEGFLAEKMIENGFGCSVYLTSKGRDWRLKAQKLESGVKLLLRPSPDLKLEDKSLRKSSVSVTFKSKVTPPMPSILPAPLGDVRHEMSLEKEEVDPRIQALQTELYAHLLKVRRTVAEETGYSPHSIASNKVLLDMAKFRPSTKEQLVRLEDFSALKAEKFGDSFLVCIIRFCTEKNLKTDDFPKNVDGLIDGSDENLALKEALMTLTSSQRQSYILFMLKKLSLENTAIQAGLKTSTIVSHMCDAIKAGLDVNVQRLGLARDYKDLIMKTILAPPINGVTSSLTKIKDGLPASVEYNHIKLVIAKMVFDHGQTVNDDGNMMINTKIVTPIITSPAQDSPPEAPSSSWIGKRSSSPLDSQSSRPTKMTKSSTVHILESGENKIISSPPTVTCNSSQVSQSQSHIAPRRSNSQDGTRSLPAWMQSAQNKTVFKKKLKSNSLFK